MTLKEKTHNNYYVYLISIRFISDLNFYADKFIYFVLFYQKLFRGKKTQNKNNCVY